MNSKKRYSLPHKMVLKRKQEIERILKSGNQVRGRVFNAFINQADKTRVAFLIDKHVGNAVQRNKMKRLDICRPDLQY